MLVAIHVLSRDGQSTSGSRDTLTGGAVCMCPSMYCPGMVRVFQEFCPGIAQLVFHLKNFYAIQWRHWTSLMQYPEVHEYIPCCLVHVVELCHWIVEYLWEIEKVD